MLSVVVKWEASNAYDLMPKLNKREREMLKRAYPQSKKS